jgi:tripartite-type tricarboxylate transporter receptor subunit TctC
MTMLSRTLIAMMLAFAALSPARAGDWPSRPVTFVVPFPAGGPTDGAARIIAKELSEQLKQQFVVENRGGGGGDIGAAAVAAANPDGYTLLFATPGPGAMNKLIYRTLPFDPAKDFSPVVLVANIPQLIVASPKLQAGDLKQLVAYGKAHPGKLNVGNPGLGTFGHIAAVLFAQRTGLEVTHVPYRGVGPLMTDVMGGQIDFAFAGFVPSATSMKVLAVTATERIKALPNVPTVIETGVADVVSGTWYGILAPAGTPRPIIDKVNRAVNAFVKSERAKKFGDPAGMLMQGGSPEDMAAYIAAEMKLWGPVIRAAKIHID